MYPPWSFFSGELFNFRGGTCWESFVGSRTAYTHCGRARCFFSPSQASFPISMLNLSEPRRWGVSRTFLSTKRVFLQMLMLACPDGPCTEYLFACSRNITKCGQIGNTWSIWDGHIFIPFFSKTKWSFLTNSCREIIHTFGTSWFTSPERTRILH